MIGENLGSFRIESILGTGAMGVVYRAVNEATGRLAAVKVINGETSQKGKAYERFRARPRSSSSSATPTSSASWPSAGTRGPRTSRWSTSTG